MEPITVLMVDDETQFTAPLSKRLARRGYDILTARNGAEGLEVLDRNPVDVVLLDITMPGMDGIKTLGLIKQRHPSVEVLMLTAHAESSLAISSLGMGAYDYLMKPVELGELVRKLESAMHRRSKNLSANRR